MHREVTFTPQLEDHVAGQRLWYRAYQRRPLARFFLVAIVVLALGGLGTMAWDLAVGWSLARSLGDKGAALFGVLVMLGVLVWTSWRIPAQVRRMAEQQPSLFSETSWRWDGAGLVADSAAGTSRVEWASLYGWLADGKSIVVRPQERIVLILPRHVLSPEQDADLIATLERFAVKARRS
ncbi:YcxB family protein [Sphingomonas kyeonggiensis]|uniref:YcxB family protein n=1 Tax=Sphingomonas kyeonggiensis TaxID=1268553 RepID=UPI0027D76D94|nr:YcxB family protein [Sphingomonas kyeonggiensis]